MLELAESDLDFFSLNLSFKKFTPLKSKIYTYASVDNFNTTDSAKKLLVQK